MFLNRNEVEKIRNQFPKGTKVELIKMKDPQPVPDGTKGVVTLVDDAGQIHVKWENGSNLALVYNVDEFKII